MFGICLRLQVYQQLRDELAKAKTLEGITDVSRELKLRCQVPLWAPNSQNTGLTETACGLPHAPDLPRSSAALGPGRTAQLPKYHPDCTHWFLYRV